MKRRIFHLFLKSTLENKYYGSLAAVFLDNKNLGISKFSLDRYDFDKSPFENETCIIIKGFVFSTGDIRNAAEGNVKVLPFVTALKNKCSITI